MKTLHYLLLLFLLLFLNFIYSIYGPSEYAYAEGGYPQALGTAMGRTFISLLAGALVWLPIRVFKGASLAPGIRDFSLKTGYVVSAIFVAYGYLNPSSSDLSQSDREVIYQEASLGCVSSNMAEQEETGFSREEILSFCECYASALSQEITYQEGLSLIQTGSASDSLTKKMFSVNLQCVGNN